jgi:hypothetical protein
MRRERTRIQQQSEGYEQTAELGRKKVVRTRKQLRNREEKDGEEEVCEVRDRGLIWMDEIPVYELKDDHWA